MFTPALLLLPLLAQMALLPTSTVALRYNARTLYNSSDCSDATVLASWPLGIAGQCVRGYGDSANSSSRTTCGEATYWPYSPNCEGEVFYKYDATNYCYKTGVNEELTSLSRCVDINEELTALSFRSGSSCDAEDGATETLVLVEENKCTPSESNYMSNNEWYGQSYLFNKTEDGLYQVWRFYGKECAREDIFLHFPNVTEGNCTTTGSGYYRYSLLVTKVTQDFGRSNSGGGMASFPSALLAAMSLVLALFAL